MDNYVMLNGKKIELTESQVKEFKESFKQLGYNRVEMDEKFYCIDEYNEYGYCNEAYDSVSNSYYNAYNYFTSEELVKFKVLNRLLNEKLERYRHQQESDTVDWENPNQVKHSIHYYHNNQMEISSTCFYRDIGVVYFAEEKTAKNALYLFKQDFLKLIEFYNKGF
jgi:hypothetical protein